MTQSTTLRRYPADDLRLFASRLLQNAGLPEEPAGTTSRVLLEADLLGFSTHGLMYLPANLDWLEKGKTRATGEPEEIAHVVEFLTSEKSGFVTGQLLLADGGRTDYLSHV
jgi:LDH2 family malate/lactate/ureidoglycolate dehydrogenase